MTHTHTCFCRFEPVNSVVLVWGRRRKGTLPNMNPVPRLSVLESWIGEPQTSSLFWLFAVQAGLFVHSRCDRLRLLNHGIQLIFGP